MDEPASTQMIDYLREENRVLRHHFRGRRLRLNDDQRRRLAARDQIRSLESGVERAQIAQRADEQTRSNKQQQ